MVHQRYNQPPDAGNNQVWLVGGGIASLAAAVFLIHDAKVPPSHIHIFDVHSRPGGGIVSSGDAVSGYVLNEGHQISRHDACTEKFLSLVTSAKDANKTLWDEIRDLNLDNTSQKKLPTRFLVDGVTGLDKVDDVEFGLSFQDRLDVIRVILESEDNLIGKKISDMFRPEFFFTKFWMIWETTFAFSPKHSAAELRRYFRKFLYEIVSMPSASILFKTRYTQYESIIQPVTDYLVKEGVNFRLNEYVVDIVLDLENDPNSVSKIKYRSPSGIELHVTVEPDDLTLVTLGSISSGVVKGTNTAPAVAASDIAHESAWSLWHGLAQKSSKFGNPSNFSTHVTDSKLLTFSVTTKDSEFFEQAEKLAHNMPGPQSFLSLADSSWLVNLAIPSQPVFRGQPSGVYVVWGWALHPEKEGDYIKKPMIACSGEEILMELLQHLHFPLVPTLSSSITIPCINPLSTAPLLPRACNDRPPVIPDGIINMALLGQFVEIADEATLSVEYSVRSAQIAVNRLMDLNQEAPAPHKSHALEFLDLLA